MPTFIAALKRTDADKFNNYRTIRTLKVFLEIILARCTIRNVKLKAAALIYILKVIKTADNQQIQFLLYSPLWRSKFYRFSLPPSTFSILRTTPNTFVDRNMQKKTTRISQDSRLT